MVSCVIPVHNAENFIKDALTSIRSQTFTDWEVIMVEDHSTDRSVEMANYCIESLRCSGCSNPIRLLDSGDERGAAAARNVGIKAAKGRYIAFLDADDMWEMEKLEYQLEFVEHTGAAFSFTGYEFADEWGVGIDKIVRIPNRMNYRQALGNTTIFTSTVMFDTTQLSEELMLMPQVPSEDTATWWKILKAGYTAYGLNKPLTLYRRSGGTLSSNKKEAMKRTWNLYRNVEGLGVLPSAFYFSSYAFHALWRRL